MPAAKQPRRDALRVAPSKDLISTQIAMIDVEIKALQARKKELRAMKREL